jgi:hypothetical protein
MFVTLNKDGHPIVTGAGTVTEDDASLELIAQATTDLYMYVEKLSFSVYKAAIGGGGILELKDTDGEIWWAINVDGVKEVNLDWGDVGIKMRNVKNLGLRAVLSGAGTQASVSIGISGHLA